MAFFGKMRALVVAATVLGTLAVGGPAGATTLFEGQILVGNGGGCERSPDCAAFRVTCDPATAPLDGITAAVLDVRPYAGRQIRLSHVGAALSLTSSKLFMQFMSDDCVMLTTPIVVWPNSPVVRNVGASGGFVVLTASAGSFGVGYRVTAA